MMYQNFEYVLELSERASVEGRGGLCEDTVVKFVWDLTNLLDVLKRYYPNDFEHMVVEQKSVFAKFEKIAAYYPEALDVDIFLNFLEDVLLSGYLPHPTVYCEAKLIDESLMAQAAILYLDNQDVQQWMVDNWGECKKYKPIISEALHKQKKKLTRLVRLCHMHYGKKTLMLLLVIWGCGGLYWFETAYPLALFLMLGIFVFLLREISVYLRAISYLRNDMILR